MVVKDYLPISIVEREGLNGLMSILTPNIKIPLGNTIRSRRSKTCEDKNDDISRNFKYIEYVTTDTWTSNATDISRLLNTIAKKIGK